jgi:hypothetical protein
MKLRFLARGDLLVRELGVHRYYGRAFDAPSRGWPATKEGCEFDADSPDALKCAKACRKGELYAATPETAAAVGVDFIATEFKDGVIVPVTPKKTTASNKGDS